MFVLLLQEQKRVVLDEFVRVVIEDGVDDSRKVRKTRRGIGRTRRGREGEEWQLCVFEKG